MIDEVKTLYKYMMREPKPNVRVQATKYALGCLLSENHRVPNSMRFINYADPGVLCGSIDMHELEEMILSWVNFE